jgi:hypothetical protein
MVLLLLLLDAVEASRSIRASNDAVFAPKASPKVLHHDPVFPTMSLAVPSRRAHAHTVRTARDELMTPGIFPVGYSDDLIPEDIPSRSLVIR